AWLRTRLRERATWRELGYAVILAVFFTGANAGFVALLGLSGILLATPVIVWALAPETVMIIPGHAIPGPWAALPFCAVGLLGLVLCAYVAGLLAAAQVKVAFFLLSPREEHSHSRVIELTRSRIRLADAFEAERRRIERDLHDGAQQQLVALSMTLGLAQMEMGESTSPAAELVSRARDEARQALDELRRLVRGIHPQVLTDHGLAAAVAEVALGHPLPITVDFDLPHRLPGPVETTAYFTVTEALTNAAKHSGASQVAVVGRYTNDRLIVVITDDGHGGADPALGTGLSGLADRMAILKGRLVVSSPKGGPTQLRVEVPCSG
ncbi:sensor histidine kinase, partial [Streptomyces decoyicus]